MENNSNNVMLLAFDGLSKKDVDEQWVLDEFKMDEYTGIDLGDRPFYFTSEIFTDLYTGWTCNQHGVKGLKKMTEGRFGINPTNFELWLQENMHPLFFSTKNMREGLYQIFLDSRRVKWERQDIKMPTLFTEFDNVYQGQMPVHDWRKADVFHHMEKEYDRTRKCVEHIEDEFVKSKNKFWQNIEQVPWSKDENQVYMHHFHFIDWLEHLYREQPVNEDRDFDEYWNDKMSDPWFKAADFLEQVKKWCNNNNVELVVMSDHGIPERGIGHRPNAFISTENTELIPEENPSIQELNYMLLKILRGEEANLNQ